MKLKWEHWTVLAVFVLMLLWSFETRCQTVCVRDPLLPMTTKAERQPLREQVEGWVQKKGFKTGCEKADWEILVEPLQGTVDSGWLYFVVSHSDGVGRIGTSRSSYEFSSWLVILYPFGRSLSVDQQLGSSLRKGVNKTLRKAGRTVANSY